MSRPPLEVADIFRNSDFFETQGPGLSPDQRRTVRAIVACRTAACGGHKKVYDCGHEDIAYNSCRNRHCPKCQAMARADWLAARQADLLPVPYFHVVFTLPDDLGPLALQNKRRIYDLLFRVAAETLITIGRDPKHLGADVGFLAVLHTWGQNLLHHPHVHCVVPGGGLDADGERWVACPTNFFLSVKVLSRLFRRRFLEALMALFEVQRLEFHGALTPLAEPKAWRRLLATLRKRDWVVYAKPPFGGPDTVLKYLARYTHRVAISNHRLVNATPHHVTFRCKDYRRDHVPRLMTLTTAEFLRRFLLHVLPHRFTRIRYYGYLANAARRKKVAHIRRVLHAPEPPPVPDDAPVCQRDHLCPQCHKGRLVATERFDPLPSPPLNAWSLPP